MNRPNFNQYFNPSAPRRLSSRCLSSTLTVTIASLLIFVTLSSCSDRVFPEFIKLESLRILALKADHPEVLPETQVTITPYISDINGNGRPLQYSADVCVDPGTSYGAEPSCEGNPTRIQLADHQTAAALSGQFTSSTTEVKFDIPKDILDRRRPQDQFNGVPYLFTYQIFAGTETVKAFKKILVVTGKTSLNNNPDQNQLEILFNSITSSNVSGLPSGEQTLTLQFNAADRESYQLATTTGSLETFVENLTTTWFISDGEIKYYRTQNDASTIWTPPGALPTGGRKIVIVAVVRDGRGGVAVLKKELP